MVSARRLRSTAIAVTLLLCAAGADALTLGRARGAVILGRPLQITIPATLDASEPELCVQADLFQGDIRTGPLEVTIERADGLHLIRVRSTALIEEPMITVYLRAGCAQQFTRGYVMLADMPQDTLPLALAPSRALSLPAAAGVPQQPDSAPPAIAAQPSAAAPAAETGLPLRAATVLPQPAGDAAAQAAPARAKRHPAAPRAPVAKRAQAKPPRDAVKAAPVSEPKAAPRGPRLKLEAIDMQVESAPPLKLTPQLTVPGTGTGSGTATGTGGDSGSSAAKADAAAQWKVLSASPEALAAQARRAEAMEAELKSLREAMQRNTQGMALLAAQLESARAERNLASNSLAVLAAVLAAGMIFMLWLRARDSAREQTRWRAMVSRESMLDESLVSQAAGPMPRQHEPVDDINSDWTGIDEGGEDSRLGVASSRPPSRPVALGPLPEFAQSEVGNQRLPNAEELIDIKQKADFFIALGQHAQAVELLEAQIHDHLGSSPLVWLDLLDICQRFGRREDYERIRAEFQTAFVARLPAFDADRRESAGLEDHPRALSRICLLWPSPRVLQVIEESLFGNPHQPSAITFDLHASRDLLLLYSLAKEVVQQIESEQPQAAADSEAAELQHSGFVQATEPVPLASLDQEPAPALPEVAAPDVDLDFVHPDPSAAPANPPAVASEYDFDFEPKARHTASS